MKKIILFCLLIQTFECFAKQEVAKNETSTYFYLDTNCESCSINGIEKSIYIQSDIHFSSQLNEKQIETFINNFKFQILQKYPNSKRLVGNIVLSKKTLKTQKKLILQRS